VNVNRHRDRLSPKPPQIGVLLDSLADPYHAGVLRGMHEPAEHAGVRLRCFVGGQLPVNARAPGRHRVYDLCNARNVDALVVLGSTLAHTVGSAGLARHCEGYRPLPRCSIGVHLPGLPSVTVDNEVGMRGVIEHTIRAHGARRIAFVRGPLANAEAELRACAYRAALAEHGIAFDERLVVPGTFLSASGRDAVRALADAPGTKLDTLDVIAASNDAMAIGVLAGLEARQIAVPDQIRVVGFDDIEDARVTQPALTTVRQPLERLGQEGLSLALEWLHHGAPPAQRELATEPVIRRSCGCTRPSGRAGPSLGPERSLGFEAALLMKRERIILELNRVAGGSFAAAGADWPDRLLNALVADLRSPEPGGFVSCFDTLLERLLEHGIDLNSCDDVLGALRCKVVPLLRSDRARSERAEDLFHLCRLATSQAIQRGLMRERLYLGRWSLALNAACQALASSVDRAELEARSREHLTKLGIRKFMLVVYDGPGDAGGAHVLCSHETTGAHTADVQGFDRDLLLPSTSAMESGSLVVLPLVSRGRNLGHVLLDLDLRHTFAYGALAEAMSTGLHAAYLEPPSVSAH
jgi:DNA-binding LacI/PurR family transcriptional regulator